MTRLRVHPQSCSEQTLGHTLAVSPCCLCDNGRKTARCCKAAKITSTVCARFIRGHTSSNAPAGVSIRGTLLFRGVEPKVRWLDGWVSLSHEKSKGSSFKTAFARRSKQKKKMMSDRSSLTTTFTRRSKQKKPEIPAGRCSSCLHQKKKKKILMFLYSDVCMVG